MKVQTDCCNTNFSGNSKKSRLKSKKDSLKAYFASQLPQFAALPIGLGVVKGMQSQSKSLSLEQKNAIVQAADKVLDIANLRSKGVKINDLRAPVNSVSNVFIDLLNPVIATENGKNAFFGGVKGLNGLFGRIFANEVVCNMDKLPTAVFHELGHAFNANNSKFWKCMQGIRVPAIAASMGLTLFAAFTKSEKADNNPNSELTNAQKAKNFVRNNAGPLAFAAMIPVLLEEGMATIRGNAWAKDLLSPDIAKNVCKGNKIAYLSYLTTALALGASAFVAGKVKDKLSDKQNQV